ncbi:MAG: hypothetical protein AABY64_04270 [Bdellovibrionota bacterium]
MINLRKTLTQAHDILEKNNISHALIGGFALATYGLHRATSDVDFLADGAKKNLIKTSLISSGFSLKHESDEVLQFSGPGFLDILLANRPLSLEMLKQAIKNSALGVHVLKAEDIIGLKIQAYKNDPTRELQDKADIQKLLQVPNVDLSLIKKYADLFNEWEIIKQLAEIQS